MKAKIRIVTVKSLFGFAGLVDLPEGEECDQFVFSIKRAWRVSSFLAYALIGVTVFLWPATHTARAAESRAIDLPTGVSNQSLTRDDSGVPTAVWVDGGIKWSQWATVWSSPASIGGDIPNDLRVTSDDLGVITIVWTAGGHLKAMRLAGGSWNTVVSVDTSAHVSAAVSDRSGTTTVFLDTSPLSATQYDGNTFSTPSAYSGAELQAYSSDGQGRTYVAWKNNSNSCLYVARIAGGLWSGIGVSACTTYSMVLMMTSSFDGGVDLFYSMERGCSYGYPPNLSARKYHFESTGIGTSSLIQTAQCPNNVGSFSISYWTSLAVGSFGHSRSILNFYQGSTTSIFIDNSGSQYTATSGSYLGPSAFAPIRVFGSSMYLLGAPESPTIASVVSGKGFLDVAWNESASASPVTGYSVTTTDGSSQCLWISGPLTCRLSNLVNGRYYELSVRGINSSGTGPASALTGDFPYGAPDPPVSVNASLVTTSTVSVAFNSGENNGAGISQHTATCGSTDGGESVTASATSSPILVSNLTPARTYKCTVYSTNARGPSTPSEATEPFVSGYPIRASIVRGNGVVTSDDASLRCSDSCASAWMSSTIVTLTATPATGWVFSSWGGACSGATRVCSLLMNQARDVTVFFVEAPPSAPVTTKTPTVTKDIAPQTPTSVNWTKPSITNPLVATFPATTGTTYLITATLTKAAKTLRIATTKGSCKIKSGKATCAIKLKTRGTWSVTITPKKNGSLGKPVKKIIKF